MRGGGHNVPGNCVCNGGLGSSHEGAKVGIMAVCYSGPIEVREQVLRPVREFGPPLADLKRTYDPTNLFRHNQNIKPTV